MLTSKALSKKVTATYCTASNTIYIHKANILPKNVYSANAKRVMRNITQQQLQAFKQLPATFLQQAKAKAFPALSTYANTVAKLFAQ